ncbi:hypothetical protein AOLI_G00026850 [Acnodon oligacanthus]
MLSWVKGVVLHRGRQAVKVLVHSEPTNLDPCPLKQGENAALSASLTGLTLTRPAHARFPSTAPWQQRPPRGMWLSLLLPANMIGREPKRFRVLPPSSFRTEGLNRASLTRIQSLRTPTG